MNDNYIVITGASSGIGLVMAKKFASLNSHVILVAIRLERLSELKLEIKKYIPQLMWFLWNNI